MPSHAGRSLRACLPAAATVLVVGLAACAPGTPTPNAAPRTSAAASSSAAPAPATNPYPKGLTRYAELDRVPLPELAGPTLDGASVSTATMRGQVVVVNAWGSWCDPCREELPALAGLADRDWSDDVVFLGLNEVDTPQAAERMLTQAGIGYPQLVDDGTRLRLLSAWLPEALPGTLVVDREGRVAARVVGVIDVATLEPLLRELAASAPASPRPSTPEQSMSAPSQTARSAPA